MEPSEAFGFFLSVHFHIPEVTAWRAIHVARFPTPIVPSTAGPAMTPPNDQRDSASRRARLGKNCGNAAGDHPALTSSQKPTRSVTAFISGRVDAHRSRR